MNAKRGRIGYRVPLFRIYSSILADVRSFEYTSAVFHLSRAFRIEASKEVP